MTAGLRQCSDRGSIAIQLTRTGRRLHLPVGCTVQDATGAEVNRQSRRVDALPHVAFVVQHTKPTGVVSAAASLVGGGRAQQHLKTVLLGMGTPVCPAPELLVGAAHTKVTDGVLSDEASLLPQHFEQLLSGSARDPSAERDVGVPGRDSSLGSRPRIAAAVQDAPACWPPCILGEPHFVELLPIWAYTV